MKIDSSPPASPPDVRRALPRRILSNSKWAVPVVRALPVADGAKPKPRAQPNLLASSYGGAEPHLTSGGEAVSTPLN